MERKRKKLMTKERRKSIRLEETLSVVRCPIKYLFDTNALSRDISEDGICILCSNKVEIGQSIKLGIYLPEYKIPITALGEVMRRNETGDAKFPFMLGIQFTKISPDDKQKISEHVHFYMIAG